MLYWLLQLSGWGTVFLLNSVPLLAGQSNFPPSHYLLTMGLCAASGLVTTHQWRRLIKRQHYLDIPLAQSARRYLASVFVLGVVLTFQAAVWFQLLLVHDTFRRIDWIPYAFTFWLLTGAMWTAAYVGAVGYRRSKANEKQRAVAELQAREARLESLRKQLNPHFLFNSLNSLRALIFEDAEKASQMVDRLAALLRYSLQAGSGELVTLAEELVMVNEYLSIEKIRFEERLNVEIEIADQTSHAVLPRMLLQTLVENAVRHGIERSISGGTVRVVANIQQDRLCIRVRNPGALSAASNSTQIGLKNAEQRLALLVGGAASLKLSQSNGEVEANVVVPQ